MVAIASKADLHSPQPILHRQDLAETRRESTTQQTHRGSGPGPLAVVSTSIGTLTDAAHTRYQPVPTSEGLRSGDAPYPSAPRSPPRCLGSKRSAASRESRSRIHWSTVASACQRPRASSAVPRLRWGAATHWNRCNLLPCGKLNNAVLLSAPTPWPS